MRLDDIALRPRRRIIPPLNWRREDDRPLSSPATREGGVLLSTVVVHRLGAAR